MDFGKLLDDLGINPTVIGIQAAIFITTFVVLSRLLFGRVLGFMQRREEEQAGLAEKVRRQQEEAKRLQVEVEARLAQAEKEAYARLQDVLKEAIDAKGKKVAEAQRKSRGEIDAARTAIAEEKSRAMERLKVEVERLAREAADRILEESVGESVARRGGP